MEVITSQKIIAISGVKNAGKTTLMIKLIAFFQNYGLKVATIKHDGHDFKPDVPGTDTYRHRKAGAFGTAIFSDGRWMVVKEEKGMDEKSLISLFPEADLIVLEGFKFSSYDKVEVIRQEIGSQGVCNQDTVIAYYSDVPLVGGKCRTFGFDEEEGLFKYLLQYLNITINDQTEEKRKRG